MPITPDRSADLLRAAAEKLRQTATAAGGEAWTAEHFPEGTIVRPAANTHSLFRLAAHGNRAAGTPCVTPRVGTHMALLHPGVGLALAQLLERHVKEYDASVVAAANVWPNSADEAARWLAAQVPPEALAVARQLLGTTSETTAAPPAPLAEVWTVWREDEPVYGHFATVDDARQGTIDCWQDDEPVCPDYSWRKDGPRLELVVGGEHSGVYASRHRVYGAPPAPADRAAVLLEAADEIAGIDFHPNARARSLDIATGLAHRLRALAGEAAAGAPQQPTDRDVVEAHELAFQAATAGSDGEAAAGAPHPEQAQPELTEGERQFLTFAMDLAFDEMVSNDGFTDEDHAALEKFRALATPAVPAAPEETR